jgi:ABC-type glycerol-3-phosphate transport system substrate-binding protein
MKKYTFILALGVALTLTACGSGSATTEKTDSTAVSTDTTHQKDTTDYKNENAARKAELDSTAK